MKETRILMGMPVTVNIAQPSAKQEDISAVFDYFQYIDNTFSTFKPGSEITKINNGLVLPGDYSPDMETVLELSEKTTQETGGYFDIKNNEGKLDPSGLVKGWAIKNAAALLQNKGYRDFYVEAGGDIQVSGNNGEGKPWSVGIKNPFELSQTVKTVYLKHNQGIATSGSYERGSHIYNPKNRNSELARIASITVIGPDVYQADRFATAAFAMQEEGVYFIEKLEGFEAYAIDNNGLATMTGKFKNYLAP